MTKMKKKIIIIMITINVRVSVCCMSTPWWGSTAALHGALRFGIRNRLLLSVPYDS